jgi:argininosuccinate lyase
VENVNDLVLNGVSFRDAYVQVGQSIENQNFEPNRNLNHTHEGSIGNLCNEEIEKNFLKFLKNLININLLNIKQRL